MANYNNWTWAQSNWTATYTQSTLYMGSNSYDDYIDAFYSGFYFYGDSVMVGNLEYQTLHKFGFGQAYSDGTASFEDLLNSNETLYGNYTNLTIMTLDFQGLGLPSPLFWSFSALLSKATQGLSYCYSQIGGYCSMPDSCDAYPDLWDY